MPSSRFIKSGLTLLATVAASAVLVTPALASAARPAGTGQFSSWTRAQHAAGFGLRRPRTTYGLRMEGKILVDQCVVTGHLKDKIVEVNYGNFTSHSLGIEQDNASGPCGNGEQGSSLGSYRVQGVRAHLYGYCGSVAPQYSCKSLKIELWLTWHKGRDYYVASSFDESRSRLVHFARVLRKV